MSTRGSKMVRCSPHRGARCAARRLALVGVAAIGTVAGAAHVEAQTQSTSSGGRGRIAGVVADSMHHRPLTKALITIVGSGRWAETNDRGEFVIDSLVPGGYALEIKHPLLDTIGLRLITPEMSVNGGNTRLVYLAIPSAHSLIQRFCPAALDSGPGAVFGRILDSETGQPARGATVFLTWRELQWKKEVSLTPHTRSASVDSDGFYHICGLPQTLSATLQIVRGGAQAGPLRVSFDSGSAGVQAASVGGQPLRSVAPTRADSDSMLSKPRDRVTGHASVIGFATTESGYALAGVQVALLGSGIATTTNAEGRFVLNDQPSGTQVLVARRAGYAPIERTVDLTEKKPVEVVLRIGVGVPILQSVNVLGDGAQGLENAGFFKRKKDHAGHYYDASDFRKNTISRFTDIFLKAGVPEVRISQDNLGNTILTESRPSASACVNIYIDHFLQRGLIAGDLDMMLQPDEIAGMEVYSRSNVPSEFVPQETLRTGKGILENEAFGLMIKSTCATIVIWTKFMMHQR